MVLNNTIWITILSILGFSLLIMILNRRMRDRCLKDFDGFLSTMLDKSDKRLWGRLKVYTTGLEFSYRDEHVDKEGHIETSSIFYKQEFDKLFMVVRFHDELSERNQARRIRQLNKSFHPKLFRRLARNTRNLMVNLKDALTEITGTVVSSISASSPAAKAFTGQQRQLTRAQTELVGYAGTAYDPILERHIGSQVVLEITNPSNVVEEYVGVLKEYSADFLEVMGVKYKDRDTIRECDIIVPRSHSFIRHSNEPIKLKLAQNLTKPI